VVGRTGNGSGYSTGTVLYTGVNNVLGNNLFETNCGSLGGDSGGPYFGSPSLSNPLLAGIHLGGYNDTTNKTTYFRGVEYLWNAGYWI
jgi:hypothetical protein